MRVAHVGRAGLAVLEVLGLIGAQRHRPHVHPGPGPTGRLPGHEVDRADAGRRWRP